MQKFFKLLLTLILLSTNSVNAIEVWHSGKIYDGETTCIDVLTFYESSYGRTDLKLSISVLNEKNEILSSNEVNIKELVKATPYSHQIYNSCSNEISFVINSATETDGNKTYDVLDSVEITTFQAAKISVPKTKRNKKTKASLM